MLVISYNLRGQIKTPLEMSGYSKLTSNMEMLEYLKSISQKCRFIKLDTLAVSPGGRVVPYLIISKFAGKLSDKKIKALLFAQQHGNEHSGKEGLLMLIREFVEGRLDYLLNDVELILVPQMNPDGNDKDQRRNGNEADLNRNHLILTEPETIGLHKLFNKIMPEATLDLHEYTPYSKEWRDYGYIKNYDEQIGTLTNPNIDSRIISLQKDKALPYLRSYLAKKGFTSAEYSVGGPPDKSRLRNSTFDVNDGRQSLGILNTFSFIVEGKNGKTSIENIKHRAEGQFNAALGFLDYVATNKNKIKSLIKKSRISLITNAINETSLQMEHVPEGKQTVSLFSIKSNKDTLLEISNYDTGTEILKKEKSPKGYIISKTETNLLELIKKHDIKYITYKPDKNNVLCRYRITDSAKKNIEDLDINVPVISKSVITLDNNENYVFIPIAQLRSKLLMLMFEPASMAGILQYEKYAFMLKKDSYYPIIRVE